MQDIVTESNTLLKIKFTQSKQGQNFFSPLSSSRPSYLKPLVIPSTKKQETVIAKLMDSSKLIAYYYYISK